MDRTPLSLSEPKVLLIGLVISFRDLVNVFADLQSILMHREISCLGNSYHMQTLNANFRFHLKPSCRICFHKFESGILIHNHQLLGVMVATKMSESQHQAFSQAWSTAFLNVQTTLCGHVCHDGFAVDQGCASSTLATTAVGLLLGGL